MSQPKTQFPTPETRPFSDPIQSPEVKPPTVKTSRMPGPAFATFGFLVVSVLFNLFAFLGDRFFNLSVLWITVLGELLIVALVPLLLSVARRFDLNQIFSFRKISLGTLGLCFLVGLTAQFAVRLPAFLGNFLLQIFGPLYIPNSLDDGSFGGKLLFIFALLILAPVCEEILNRGFLMAGYRRLGFWRCLVIVGLFFGFFHQYPYRFLDTTLAGIILAYLALTTGSIFASMAAHFGFNFFPAVVTLFLDALIEFLRKNNSSYHFPDPKILVVGPEQVIASITFSLFGAALVFLLLRKITKRASRTRPGLFLGYSGLVIKIEEEVKTFENGPFWGPEGQPYRYSQMGYQFNRAPFPSLESLKLEPKEKRKPLKKAGWVICLLLILALFSFTSFSEVLFRDKGRVYCQIHPTSCEIPGSF